MKLKVLICICITMQINFAMCQIEWKAASDGVVPPKALGAGKEGRDKMFLCKAWHDGEIVPGKLSRRAKACIVPFAGKTHSKNIYSVAVGSGDWVTNQQNTSYNYAASAGVNKEYEDVHICRGIIDGNLVPGKIDRLECHIPFDGTERKPAVYEFLRTSYSNSGVSWVTRSNGNYPSGALASGKDDDDDLYSCRAWKDMNLFPGKLHPRNNACYIPLAGGEFKATTYSVLVGSLNDLAWKKARDGDRPDQAVVAGVSRHFQDQYICRAYYIGKLLPGHLDTQGCVVPYEDGEHKVANYEVLVHK